MPDQVVNYQCPSCTGPMHFVGSTGKLQCDYCGNTYDVAEIEALYNKKEEKAEEAFAEAVNKAEEDSAGGWDSSDMSTDWGADGENMRAYSCPSCGAELICDASTAATACPYCGNPTIVPGQFSGVLKPDYMIPFKLDQSAAEKALKEYYKGKKFLPGKFKSENKIKEIKGIYVPFWMFDGTADVEARFDATNSRSYRSGDYEITETKHYDVERAGHVSFSKIPVDASSKMSDAHMDAVEPFDYKELRPFSTVYLPGYMADKYDVDKDECAQRADERARQSAVDSMRADVRGYDSCSVTGSHVRLHRGKVSYALLPVYMLNTKWQGKDYLFAMNGQTGKFIGNLPISKGKFFAWFAGITVVLTAVVGGIMMLFE